MSLTENMSELVGGGHRSHRGKHMTKRHRKKTIFFKSFII